MNANFAASFLANNHALAEASHRVVQEVQRSLVTVQVGRRGFGAGVVWSADGHILTNHHVVARGNVKVITSDGQEWEGRLLGRDPEIDLALLKIEATGLVPARFAGSRPLRVGEWVLAVGHPWGQMGHVTGGTVSGLGMAATQRNRSIPIVRSDVVLAPGNSGGPLVNARGEVVGINTMIVGGDLGVAIPSSVVCEFVARLLPQSRGAPRPPAAQNGESWS